MTKRNGHTRRRQPGAAAAPSPAAPLGGAVLKLALAAACVAAYAQRLGRSFDGEALARTLSTSSGGWAPDPAPATLLRGLHRACDFEAVNASAVDAASFERTLRRSETPVLLRGAAAGWAARRRWTRVGLAAAYGARATQFGPGSDVVYAGGGGVGFATVGGLLAAVPSPESLKPNISLRLR